MNTKHDRKPGGTRGWATAWTRAGLIALGAAVLSSCGQGQNIFLGDQAAAYNREIWDLSKWAIGLSIIIFVGVSGMLFYTVQKFREDRNTAAPQQFHGNNRLEAWLIGIPIILVLGLSVLSVRSLARLNPVSQQTLGIEATGAQFWWNFTYPGSPVQGGSTVANGNEMVMPAEQKVAISTTSKDVIHGFWAPNLGGQRASIPTVKRVWELDTQRPGVYQGNCSQLCGASHANMRFKVIALSPERFAAFNQAAQAYVAPTPAPGSAEERGYNLFMQGKAETGAIACASCHRVQGTPAGGVSGPDLSFFGTRRTLGAGMWEAMTPAQWQETAAIKNSPRGFSPAQALHEWIKHSPEVKPGSIMPSYDGSTYFVDGKPAKGGVLTDEEIDDVAAYLRSLRLPAEADYWQGSPVHGTNTTAGGSQ